MDRCGPAVCAGRGLGLAHLVGVLLGCHGARHLLPHLLHQHRSLLLLCPHQAGTVQDSNPAMSSLSRTGRPMSSTVSIQVDKTVSPPCVHKKYCHYRALEQKAFIFISVTPGLLTTTWSSQVLISDLHCHTLYSMKAVIIRVEF